jgi:thiol:disulfide interchange protein DsbD
MIGLVIISMAVWIYGRYAQRKVKLGISLTAVALVAGLWAGWPVAAAPTDITWSPWSTQSVEQLRSQNRIIYIDFTARWCATCQANKKVVFHSNEVLKLFRDKNIATLRGDWTNRDPLISQELAKYSRSAVPFNLIWLPGKSEPVILPELLTPAIVMDAVNQK